MQQTAENIPEDYQEIGEKIRSGEFFRDARTMYDFTVHDPMSERYLYLLITGVSLIIFFVAFIAVKSLYPLQQSVPFIVSSNNIIDEIPKISSLLSYKGQDTNEALLDFMVGNYVTKREEYNIENFDRNINGVKSQSSEEVFQAFQQQIDPRNPESPIAVYQRHSKRNVNVLSTVSLPDNTGMEVIFEAIIESRDEVKKSRWQAIVAFKYSGVTIDQDSGTMSAPEFLVTQYKVKRL